MRPEWSMTSCEPLLSLGPTGQGLEPVFWSRSCRQQPSPHSPVPHFHRPYAGCQRHLRICHHHAAMTIFPFTAQEAFQKGYQRPQPILLQVCWLWVQLLALHSLAVRPWASFLITLCLAIFIWKVLTLPGLGRTRHVRPLAQNQCK